jgi:DNA-binding MarR family transcriptional regulator
MNNSGDQADDYRSLLLLDEISKNEAITQRDMSTKLGVALGLVNSYLKNLASKGYITISGIPRKRYRYYLTPKGFSEKARLTYHHLHNFTSLYRVARRDFLRLFRGIKESGAAESVVFCGVDEVAEIAFLSLSEAGLKLRAIVDDEKAGKIFFGHTVLKTSEAPGAGGDLIVITSFRNGAKLKAGLIKAGAAGDFIYDISSGDWLKRIGGAESDADKAGGRE